MGIHTVDAWMGRTLRDVIVIIVPPLKWRRGLHDYYPMSASRGTPTM